MDDGLAYLGITEAAARIKRGALSPVELTEQHLARIHRLDGHLSAFLTVTADEARAAARVAAAEIAGGNYRGPLHGIPFGLKDVYDTAGIATTGNSPAFHDRIPSRNAGAVDRLHAAGAILLGKQATHELTYGGVSDALPWPVPRNPWDPAFDTGGSSSGSGAAVAAGLSMFALGTDTGGSVRNPAAHCGVVGVKPTFGLVGRSGVMKNAFSLDHCGPIARSVRDAALVLDAIAGPDPRDEGSRADPDPGSYAAALDAGIAGWRIGVLRDLYEQDLPASAEMRAAMEAALGVLESLGAHLEPVRVSPLARFAMCKSLIQQPEIYEEYRDELAARPEAFGAKFRARVGRGAHISAATYLGALRERRVLTEELAGLAARFDVLVTAGPAGPAPAAAVAANWEFDRPEITVPFSLTGMPALSLCIGFTRSGLPLAMQIAGPHFADRRVLRAAQAYEAATGWHGRHPLL